MLSFFIFTSASVPGDAPRLPRCRLRVVALKSRRLSVEVAADAWQSRAAAARSYLQDRDGYKSATRRPHDSQVVLCTKRAPSVVYSIQEVRRRLLLPDRPMRDRGQRILECSVSRGKQGYQTQMRAARSPRLHTARGRRPIYSSCASLRVELWPGAVPLSRSRRARRAVLRSGSSPAIAALSRQWRRLR